MNRTGSLPVEQVVPALRNALRAGSGAVLQAPPAAGKTTRVPLALLDEPWLAGRSIVMLEPRRLAARMAARRMAATLGESPGATIGHRVRHESVAGAATRILVVTEGILTRMLQKDPALEEFGLVIFDEFHERSLHADLGLALTLQTRAVLRPDLRVLVMSATLEVGAVAALLGGVPGRDQRRTGLSGGGAACAAAGGNEAGAGCRLGSARRARRRGGRPPRLPARCGRDPAGGTSLQDVGADVIPLHGNLPAPMQDRAILPRLPGNRKVVLATSIAETSLTIEGVKVVVDGGLSPGSPVLTANRNDPAGYGQGIPGLG